MAGQSSTYCLQEWLYFGQLEKFLGHPINQQFFVRTVPSSGHRFIHTMALQQMLRDWRFRLSQVDEFQKREWLNTIADLLRIANAQFIYLDQDSERTRQHPLPEILFSISILLDTLSRDASALDSGIDTTQLSRTPSAGPYIAFNLDTSQ